MDQTSQITLQTSHSTIGPTSTVWEEQIEPSTTSLTGSEQRFTGEGVPTSINIHNNRRDSVSSFTEESDFSHTGSFEDDDPLNVRELAENFDELVHQVNSRVQILADQLYLHVEARKTNADIDIAEINNKLVEMRALINKCNELNMEIDKLEQLQLFTRDFNDRLENIQKSLMQNSSRH
ncbi:hypothetical protein DAMA08_006810 [Martiniozyma asiatica (nom. inval.)]|nr:hypothetical protein DAMA08_006810 [Martiniozyma asiatica]